MAWLKTSPATTTKVKDSPAIFQGNWAAIESAFEQEHQDTSDTLPGAHLPGRCGVMYVGTTAQINNLSTPPACAVSYNTTLSAFQYYTGSAWTTCSADHGELTGLSDNDHPQYLLLGSTSTGSIIASGAPQVDNEVATKLYVEELSASSIRLLATPVNLVSWTAATAFTDVDISSQTGSNTAKAALVMLELYASAAASISWKAHCRKNGSSETTILPRVFVYSGWEGLSAASLHVSDCAMVIVECDASEIFEVDLTGSGGSVVLNVDLIGYIV